DLPHLNFAALQRGGNLLSTCLVVVCKSDQINLLVLTQCAYRHTPHRTGTTKYYNMHNETLLPTYATAVSVSTGFTTLSILTADTLGVEVVAYKSWIVSSRRLRMVSISSWVMTSGGSTRITRELLSVPEMRTPRLK